MFSPTRREFLASTSLVVAGTVAGAVRLPADVGLSPRSASAFLPEPMAAIDLRSLASTAIDAARQAGATYADVRVAERHRLMLDLSMLSPDMPATQMHSLVTYGIRVIVNGTWAFAHGTVPTADAVTKMARHAVMTARGYARQTTRRVELVPAPVVTGEWSTPFRIDPFSVPLQDQAALLGAFRAAALRVRHGSDPGRGAEFHWTREMRVFASTEGSLVTQTLRRCEPYAGGRGDLGMGEHGSGHVTILLQRMGITSGGYEVVTTPSFQDEIKVATEEAVRLAELPRRSFDVGRYPVVFDGPSFGATIGQTLGPALELDRVLGYEADAAGTSYLAPPMELLGSQVASPVLNVTAHRKMPAACAVKWDDEGVEPQEYSLVTDGRLVDYHTSRETAAALGPWYRERQQEVRSRGSAVAVETGQPVVVRSPHLVVAPGAKPASLADLCKDINRGVLVRGLSYLRADHQLASVNVMGEKIPMFEIARGKIVRRIDRGGFQFGTSGFWKSLVALGDATTVSDASFALRKGQPWRSDFHSVSAPAGLFKDVNVVTSKVRL